MLQDTHWVVKLDPVYNEKEDKKTMLGEGVDENPEWVIRTRLQGDVSKFPGG